MKKSPVATEKSSAFSKVHEFMAYLELSKLELRKVTWPSLKETRTTSLVVLAFVTVMAIFLGLVDLGLSKLISLILSA